METKYDVEDTNVDPVIHTSKQTKNDGSESPKSIPLDKDTDEVYFTPKNEVRAVILTSNKMQATIAQQQEKDGESQSSMSVSFNDEYLVDQKYKNSRRDDDEPPMRPVTNKKREPTLYDENNYCLARSSSVTAVDNQNCKEGSNNTQMTSKKCLTKNNMIICLVLGILLLAGMLAIGLWDLAPDSGMDISGKG